MKKKKSKKKVKIAIILFSFITLASVVGFTAYQYSNFKSWSNLIYPGVKIEGEDISGKTQKEAKDIIQKKYGAITNKKLNISVGDKNYILDYSKMNPKYNIEDTVNEAFQYGKEDNIIKKYKIIKGKESKEYKLKFSYDSKPVKELIASIEKEVNKDPVNASLKGSGGDFTVVPEQNGMKLQKDKLEKEVSAKINGDLKSDTNIKAPIEVINARITADKISSIDGRISSYSTNYGSISSSERANNIVLATKSINGTILMPGDVFSFNDAVGERTADRGYQAAPVIIGNQVDSGLGGGICQVSSTLYNAVLKANIKSVERAHHTLPSHYVPLGLDATVDYGNIDYKFKNTLDYPIYIEGSTYGGVVAFNIYANKSLANTVTELISNVYDTIQPGVKYIDDPTMLEGQTEQTQNPSTGFKAKVIKRTSQNGKLISEEVISDDYYKPVDAIIKRGTKK